MKVIVDDKIPYIKDCIEQLADEVVYLPGAGFTPSEIAGADALIVRTRTQCNRQLLAGSQVRFIATATIGYDHIDTAYCREAGITWCNAPGCNAASVEQYMQSALLLLAREKGFDLAGKCLGIVGMGHVGSRVEKMATALGMHILRCDPPRAHTEGAEGFVDLKTIAQLSDVITFHTPLTREGTDRTYHLADADFLNSLQRKPVLFNTSRGEVVDNRALAEAWKKRKLSAFVLDVWENEPNPDRFLLQEAFLATPHIAGYSADGKANATRMALDAFCRYFQLTPTFDIQPPAPNPNIVHASTHADALLQIYNPENDSNSLKEHPECFEQFRGNYPLRREAKAYQIITPVKDR